ncbi:endonuclease/exonuclease/phosphatase family protein [Fervidibacillus albus]|uniref:Endonuclease/exonuclease/phosphatase family protein n=1 Tax=Fervidibacillus albus TaxID=2980026 RepID=A0A9E8LTB7_9BACI|nr:endonuclease/exonuclease/phosphatase family protein [Fervidibacillus albus]WAA08816.1 endonuclease/exonuclease/phosphatase family protein [Fervidibacillus albus]
MTTFIKKHKYLFVLLLLLISFVSYILYIPKVKTVKELQDGQIRIMSYNLRYGASNYEEWMNRKQHLADQIINYMPDSIGIQEGDAYWMSEEDGLPSMLDDYSYVGVGRDDGDTLGEYAAIFYLKDKYEVVDSGTFWLSETPDEVSIGWDAVANRICTWVTLSNKVTGETYTHFNTHLDHVGKTARSKSVDLLLEKIKEFDTPIVLTGDFNFFEKSDAYDKIIESKILSDSKYLASDSMSHGTMNWFLPLNFQLLRPIDFCFVSRNQIIVDTYRVDNSVWVEGKPVSDHYPVIVDMRINNL